MQSTVPPRPGVGAGEHRSHDRPQIHGDAEYHVVLILIFPI